MLLLFVHLRIEIHILSLHWMMKNISHVNIGNIKIHHPVNDVTQLFIRIESYWFTLLRLEAWSISQHFNVVHREMQAANMLVSSEAITLGM